MTENSTPDVPVAEDSSKVAVPVENKGWSLLWKSEDYWAIWTGFLILLALLIPVLWQQPTTTDMQTRIIKLDELKLESKQTRLAIKDVKEAEELAKLKKQYKSQRDALKKEQSKVYPHPLKSWFAKLGKWESDPSYVFGIKKVGAEGQAKEQADYSLLPGTLGVAGVLVVLLGIGIYCMNGMSSSYIPAFICLFLLCVVAFTLAGQEVIAKFNLEYPLWALLVGVIISNTVGTPQFMKPALRTEYFIKTGLVLLGATILMSRLLALSIPGVMVSWVVTPIVLITTYWFGQKILRIESKSLNMTICADMSVCGVSAAIATGAACRAKRDEVSLAIALSLTFTVVMMVVQPWFIRAVGMNEVLGGAWIGGTIDATGAVAAAGAFLGEDAELVASTIKMIQNILIGVIAFGVAVYWVSVVEPEANHTRPSIWEIWNRFPKFILGFAGASIFFSWLTTQMPQGDLLVASVTGISDIFRNWLFCMAFVCIGLEASLKELIAPLKSSKPLVLYLAGQTLNLLLTFLMAYLMFEIVFPDIINQIGE
jgi:uncharacterized membrane protein YadS